MDKGVFFIPAPAPHHLTGVTKPNPTLNIITIRGDFMNNNLCLFKKRGKKGEGVIIRHIIIQTSHQRSAPYTNLYTLTKHCNRLDSKIFSQPEFRNLSTSIKQPIGFMQIQAGSLVLFFLQVSLPPLVYTPGVTKSHPTLNWCTALSYNYLKLLFSSYVWQFF